MILFIGLMYGLFLMVIFACITVAKEADEMTKEIIAAENTRKRILEKYYPKR